MSRRAAAVVVPAWTGHLVRGPDGIRGELADESGWRLTLLAIPARAAVPAKLYVRGDVTAIGADAPGRAALADYRCAAGELVQDGAGWTGELAIRDTVLLLTGTLAAPGHLDLRGAG